MERERPAGGNVALLADIGGTNARFALTDGQTIGPVECLAVADYPSFTAAVESYLSTQSATPQRAAIAVAAPVARGAAAITNSPWTVAADQVKASLSLRSVTLINDFGALAWSLPHLSAEDLLPLGGDLGDPTQPRLVLGPGTGLGVATYVPCAGGACVLEGEGGHVTMPARDAVEAAVLEGLRARFNHVSAERLLCGAGLENLYRTLAEMQGTEAVPRAAADIVARGLDGTCPVSRATLERFYAMLGSVAGNAALLVGAKGGVFLAGGIVPRFASSLSASIFRDAFEAKGRMRDYLAPIPTAVILHPSPAFLGLRALLDPESSQ